MTVGNGIVVGEEEGLHLWGRSKTDQQIGRQYVMGSEAVVSLYLSLDIKIKAYEVGKHFIESAVKVENLDIESAIKFVKACASVKEI
jgi:hypothetical protein